MPGMLDHNTPPGYSPSVLYGVRREGGGIAKDEQGADGSLRSGKTLIKKRIEIDHIECIRLAALKIQAIVRRNYLDTPQSRCQRC